MALNGKPPKLLFIELLTLAMEGADIISMAFA